MEPTIYKPSIYKGAGIYKTGADGGGGGRFEGSYNISAATSTVSVNTPYYVGIDGEKFFSKNTRFCVSTKDIYNWNNINKIEAAVKFNCNAVNASYNLAGVYIRGVDDNGNYLSRIASLGYIRPGQGSGCSIRIPNNYGDDWLTNNFNDDNAWNKDIVNKIIVEKVNGGTKFYFDARPCKSTIYETIVNYNLSASLFRVAFGGSGVLNPNLYLGETFLENSTLYKKGTYVKIDGVLVFGEE